MDNQQQPVRDQGLISVASHVLDDSDIRSKIFFILLFKIGIEKDEILKGRQNCLTGCSIHCKNEDVKYGFSYMKIFINDNLQKEK